jgi:hypothetical protein
MLFVPLGGGQGMNPQVEAGTQDAARFCRIDARGHVQILADELSAKERIALVAIARALASRRAADISEDVSMAELAEATGLPKNQISARCAELVKLRLFDSSLRGTFRIVHDRIERFLDSLDGRQ